MINALKMDVYRLFKTKSMYIIWLIFAGLDIMITYIVAGLGDIDSDMEYTVSDLMVQMNVMQISLFIAIFTVLYTTADRKSGYIKNIGGQFSVRSSLMVSKAISLLLYTILSFIIYIAVQAFANRLFLGYTNWGSLKDLFRFVSVQILLHYALALVCMMAVVIISSDLIGMIIAVLLGSKMTDLFYGTINELFNDDFDIAKYTLVGQMTSLNSIVTGQAAVHAVIIGICFAIVAVTISCLFFEKRDIV